jgi:1-acyl-sn-glycerol-3-phosphate acyltransferase
MVARVWYSLVKILCVIIASVAFRFRSRGSDQIPQRGPVLLLSNHQSHLDPILVGMASERQLRFVARDSLFYWPLGGLIRSLGAIPLAREGTGLAGLRVTLSVLRAGQALVLFPEGTRTVDGSLQPLKPGFSLVARRSEATIVPVGIAGAFEALPRGRCLPRPRAIWLQFGNRISPEEIRKITDHELVELVGERMAAAHQQAVSALAATSNS